MTLVYLATLAAICLSFLVSLVSFVLKYPLHLRLISLLLGFTVLSELVITRFIHHRWKGATNIPWYNIVILIEFCVYAIYYYQVLSNNRIKKIILAYLAIFPIFWFIFTFKVFNLTNWNSYVDVVGSIFTVCLSAALYHQLMTAPELVRLSRSPEFWIATALILYYSASLPFTGMMHYLTNIFPELANNFVTFLQILNILLYSLIAYAFLCRISIKK